MHRVTPRLRTAMAGLSLLAALAASAWAAHDHDADPKTDDFRSNERPAFDRTVDAARLTALVASGDVTLLDVRLAEDFAADPGMIPGALRADPEHMDAWLVGVPRTRPVVVYCVAGKWVSQKAATRLADEGLDVYSLDGGLRSWRETHGAP